MSWGDIIAEIGIAIGDIIAHPSSMSPQTIKKVFKWMVIVLVVIAIVVLGYFYLR